MFLHINNGSCQKCREIIDRYPGIHPTLLIWFKDLQAGMPNVHTSCAGRGQLDQEAYFLRHASNAHWTKSAHNWNAALDLFNVDEKNPKNLYPDAMFKEIELYVPDWIEWYGAPGEPFKEEPHYQVRGWKDLADKNILKLVE